jgi:hypothetical protein
MNHNYPEDNLYSPDFDLWSIDPKTAPRDNPRLNYLIEQQTPRYYYSVDLGQAHDPTASVWLEKWMRLPEPEYTIPKLERYPIGTKYPDIVEDVATKFSMSPASTRLILDGTGVGRVVVDMILAHLLLKTRRTKIRPITITGGDTEIAAGGYYRIPKRNLVGAAQVLLQDGRLKIKEDLPETPTLIREMLNFKVKISAETAHDSYAAWREGEHDDLVLAAALACWAAESKLVNGEFRQWNFFR